VVISAYGWDSLRRNALQAGAAGFLPKPVLPEALRRALLPPAQGRPAELAAAAPSRALQGLRALLVEDNAVNRQLASELLRREGATIDIAVNGQQALDQLEAVGPDAYHVVLMDLQMPVMDGYEATRAIRARPAWSHLPVLAMTAHAMVEERERCLALGMRGHIAKPLDPPALVRELAAYLPAPAEPGAPAHAGLPAHAEPEPNDQHWPAWPGIDLPSALARCGGPRLLRRGLAHFAERYSGHGALLRARLAGAAWPELAREAHSLRGLGPQFGMAELGQHAAALEDLLALPGGAPDAAEAAALLDRLVAALAVVLSGLASHPPQAPHDGDPPAAPAPHSPPWPRLRALLAESDSQALVLWHEAREHFMAALSPPAARALDDAMQRCDFETALARTPAAETVTS
jgi:two-component system, sensor histidine kinase and response regulator